MDFSDDIYLVLTGERVWNFTKEEISSLESPYELYDQNTYPVEVFTPRFPVPKKLKESLKLALKTWREFE
jgi:hypothetical protein